MADLQSNMVYIHWYVSMADTELDCASAKWQALKLRSRTNTTE